jgi:MFS family permease
MTATLPGRTHGLGLITQPLLGDVGINAVQYGVLNFWAILLGAAFCLPGGRLQDRWGTRTVLTLVSLALGGVVVLMSTVSGWLALFGTLILVRGLGQGTLSVVSMALVGKWFQRRLGPAMGVYSVLLAIGFITTTLGLGQAVLQFGWRAAWAGLGLSLAFGLAPLSWLLVRSSPEACGLEVENESGSDPAAGASVPGTSLSGALRSPGFWIFTLSTSLFGLVWSAITLFNQSILQEHGFDAQTSYLVMALLTGSGLVSNLLGGWLARWWSLGRLLAVGMGLLALCLVLFPYVNSVSAIVVYSLGLGMAGGLITVIYFTFYGLAFGRSHLGQIQGAAQVLSVLASAAGPLVLAKCKEWTGSSDWMFQGAALLAVLAGISAWAVTVPDPSPAA